MYRFFLDDYELFENKILIRGEKYKHIVKSIRKKVGDDFQIVTADGIHKVVIEDIDEEKLSCKILEKIKSNHESNIRIHFCQALAKSDKPESVFQRAVELGVTELIPFTSKRTVVRIDDKNRQKKLARFEKVVEGASQQAKRDLIPEVSGILCFEDLLKLLEGKKVIFAYEGGGENLRDIIEYFRSSFEPEDIYIVIGPEGGFDEDEVSQMEKIGAKIVSLGERILRVETAGVALISILQYELGDIL